MAASLVLLIAFGVDQVPVAAPAGRLGLLRHRRAGRLGNMAEPHAAAMMPRPAAGCRSPSSSSPSWAARRSADSVRHGRLVERLRVRRRSFCADHLRSPWRRGKQRKDELTCALDHTLITRRTVLQAMLAAAAFRAGFDRNRTRMRKDRTS